MWRDQDNVARFLVADEVGLGKTVVAREIVGLTLDRLKGRTADIVYVCSSRPIATQNLDKLKGSRSAAASFSTRLSLLAEHPRSKDEAVRFIALTPATSFDIGRSTGWVAERALIWRLLRASLRPSGLEDALKIVKAESWDREIGSLENKRLDQSVAAEFRKSVKADFDLVAGLRKLAAETVRGASDQEYRRHRNALIGRLRVHLARAGVRTIAGRGLIILDEFQKFPQLMDSSSARNAVTAELATELFSRDRVHRRILLLSATPYRMLGMQDVAGEKPHADLVELVKFLTNGGDRAAELDRELTIYSRTLQAGASREAEIIASRDRIQAILRTVMVRTERVGMTRQSDAMVKDDPVFLQVKAEDLKGGIAARRIARRLGSHDTTDYWKSAPYMLEFMREYDLKRKVLGADDRQKRAIERTGRRDGLLLDRDRIKSYASVSLRNPRLRELVDRFLPPKAELLLWIPPTLSYTEPGGPFLIGRRDLKVLAFSSWQLAPEAIAALVSYEVERRLVLHQIGRRAKRGRTRKQPLNFETYTLLGDRLRFVTRSDGTGDQLGHGLSPLALLYPSVFLADSIDPFNFAQARGQAVSVEDALARATKIMRSALSQLPRSSRAGRPDERWYWAAPILLDGSTPVLEWLARDPFGFQAVKGAEREDIGNDERRMREAIEGLFDGSWTLGRRPRDLANVLARMALGAPGVCALRALKRTLPTETKNETALRRASFKIASGFRSLFNQPEAVLAVTATVRSRQPYWAQVISYAISGNLQALLDEQSHMEADGLSLLDEDAIKRLEKAGNNLAAPLRLRYAGFEIAGLGRRRRTSGSVGAKTDAIRMRGRHAARFAEIKEDDGTVTRLDAIRAAFNSPFRPFVLASTSLGQEGLDFHPWCHIVCHWNLPRGPVELEQREGRVHRYKGHAVRLNVARSTGLSALGREPIDADANPDPWARMFELARKTARHDLEPYWIFDTDEDSVRVRRLVPMPALGREADDWPLLTRRLALYRLVLGQPRQEDLLSALEKSAITTEQAHRWRINLSPPAASAPWPDGLSSSDAPSDAYTVNKRPRE
jgi:Helicase conserved C-terminal domain